jgi:hypothetical protein
MARNNGEVIYESLAEERRGEEDSQVRHASRQPFHLFYPIHIALLIDFHPCKVIIETKDTENIIGKHLEPNAAFEYFHGKIYDIPSQRSSFCLKFGLTLPLRCQD